MNVIIILITILIIITLLYYQYTIQNKFELKINTPFKYIYKKELFTKKDCKRIIKYIKTTPNLKWTNYGTLGANNDLNINELNGEIQNLINTKINKLLEKISKLYNIPKNQLNLLSKSPFIIKYDTNKRNIDAHKDNSDISFVILLNDEFEGGGTYINNLDKTLQLNVGQVLIFPGQLVHSAKSIISGERFIISGFIGINKDYILKQRLRTLDTFWLPY